MTDLIRHALLATGRVQLWPNPTGFDARAKRNYGIGLGGADQVGIIKGLGRFFGCETKTGGGVLSHEQKLWHASVKASGGFACVAHNVEEAIASLDRACLIRVDRLMGSQGSERFDMAANNIAWSVFE